MRPPSAAPIAINDALKMINKTNQSAGPNGWFTI
jgi:hypothetical protein